MSKIIGLVGEIGSGKETFAKLLSEIAKGKKVVHIRFSDILKETLLVWELPLTRENFTNLRITMNKHFGEDSLPKATAEKAKALDDDLIILDGLRWMADLKVLRSLPDAILIYITTPVDLRFERIKDRQEKKGEQSLSFDEFKNAHNTDAEILIPEIGSKADITIINDGSIEDLEEKVKDFYYNYLK